MKADFLKEYDFFAGVPDSQLKEFCNFLTDTYGISERHIIAANEGGAVALAAGYYMATRKVPVVYLQNSGLGNIINPVASLLHEKVYGIPCIFVVGWRGEPNLPDEPQHRFQGEVTLKLLADMEISTFIVTKQTSEKELEDAKKHFRSLLEKGKSVAFLIAKGALEPVANVRYQNENSILREEIIRYITAASGEDIIVSTTGKASRELFEIREARRQTHAYDFLTVGSMGHASSIALSIALQKKDSRVFCIDGDGAALMHLGAMALIGANAPKNLIHIVINNAAHETVGGMPTVAQKVNLVKIAEGCGYPNAVRARNLDELASLLEVAKAKEELFFLEMPCAIGSRSDLGRPTVSAQENLQSFMQFLDSK